MSRHTSFFAGAMATLPMIVGAAPFGLIYSTLARSQGLPAELILGMSALVFAGSAQFVAVGLIAAHASLPVIWLTTLFVNLRHMLYSASLMPKARDLGKRWRLFLAFFLTDETFAVVDQHFREKQSAHDHTWFWLGSSLAMYCSWQLWTILGLIFWQIAPQMQNWGLDFAMIATFAAIIIAQIRNRSALIATLVAACVACLAYSLPYKAGIMLAALAGVGAGLLNNVLEKRNGLQPTAQEENA